MCSQHILKTNNMTEKTYEVYYDENADFLEVFFGEPSECSADEMEEGIFVRRDKKTGEVKSIEIPGFKKRPEIFKKILEKINMKFPLKINI